MASDTKNVKLGVCKIFYDGVDLGYTKGGVEVNVTSETHKVTVDQFGTTSISETIQGRDVKVKAPLAETTLDNMVRIMPGASLVSNGAKAMGRFDYTTRPVANDTITLGGIVFTFVANASNISEITIGADLAKTLANAAETINASPSIAVGEIEAVPADTFLSIAALSDGVSMNSFTLAKNGSGVTVSGATLTGGIDATKKRVDVTSGIGVNLLDVARSLVLHPIANDETDVSEDFIIPRAATAGAITYSYQVDSERIFEVEFSGYPDPNSKILFRVGDSTV